MREWTFVLIQAAQGFSCLSVHSKVASNSVSGHSRLHLDYSYAAWSGCLLFEYCIYPKCKDFNSLSYLPLKFEQAHLAT